MWESAIWTIVHAIPEMAITIVIKESKPPGEAVVWKFNCVTSFDYY
jgi:hypothetical protein